MESRKKSHQNSTKPPKCRGLWVNFGGNFKAVARRQTGIAQILPGGLGEEASCKTFSSRPCNRIVKLLQLRCLFFRLGL